MTIGAHLEASLSHSPSRENQLAQADSERADVALAQAGDQHAFERLYRIHVNRIHSLVRRMVGSEGDVDELTQDVFVRAWERLGTFRGEAAFGTWLHRLTVNHVLNWQKSAWRERQRIDSDADADQGAGRSRAPDVAMDLEEALRLLPRGARQVFVLYDVEGYRHDEIGKMLGVTEGTSKAQLHRARMLLRNFLER
ncbi:MAG TPA: RNA polymerase sigma factor [Gemmatimonadales bacterium]|nr:RNA polymerase sigma factor [Gemmatimonadales bacterium]